MANYGLAISGMTEGFREAEGDIQRREKHEAGKQKHELGMETTREELARTRRLAKKEGLDIFTRYVLAGQLDKAEEAYNTKGDERIESGSLKYDKEKHLVTWNLADGTPGAADSRMLAATSGISLYGKKGKGGQAPASIQLLREYTRIFGSEKKAAYIMNLSKQDPSAATSRIFSALVKANEARMFDERLKEEELWEKAMGMVDQSREAQKGVFGLEPPTEEEEEEDPTSTKGKIRRETVGDKDYGNLWK